MGDQQPTSNRDGNIFFFEKLKKSTFFWNFFPRLEKMVWRKKTSDIDLLIRSFDPIQMETNTIFGQVNQQILPGEIH